MRQIDLKRGDGNTAAFDRVEVGSRPGLGGRSGSADPIDRIVPRRAHPDNRLRLVAPAKTGHFGATQVAIGDIGNIDVQQHRLGNRIAEKTLHQFPRDAAGGIEMITLETGQGKCNRRNTQQKPFGRRGNRSRINRVVTHIGTVINAGNDNIGQVIEHSGNRQMDAIRRRAINEIKSVCGLFQENRPIQRQ